MITLLILKQSTPLEIPGQVAWGTKVSVALVTLEALLHLPLSELLLHLWNRGHKSGPGGMENCIHISIIPNCWS